MISLFHRNADQATAVSLPENHPTGREETIFAAAVELPAAERTAYLDQQCGGDTSLRQRVEALLAADGRASDLLEMPPTGVAGFASGLAGDQARVTEKPGDYIGHYHLLEEIGVGGCGVVYLAEQEKPVRRQVALKIIKLGMDTRQVVARFEFERQTLASMDHPNIAQVFDAGETATGRPYFVMELVRGERITRYCDERKLSTHQRLELFLQVCSAMQHAHQKGVIHRDLKPSNILVGEVNGAPLLKVIDFGIAKATNQEQLADKTLFTAAGQFVGTPAYVSPEQAQLGGVDVDTRSDIYSLGVLLYELLTGTTPLDSQQLLRLGMEDLCRTVREEEPPTPSRRLTTLGTDKLAEVAGRHSAGAPRLLQTLRGDLDWIVMKALEKDRTRRYESADALAGDIRRYLNNEPVLARPPSAAYLFRKLVRRHRLAFGAGAVIATTVIIALAVSLRLHFELQTERERPRQEAALGASETGLNGVPETNREAKAAGKALMSLPPSAMPGEIFRRTTISGEDWTRYSASFTPKKSGAYMLGFNLIASGLSGDNSILVDAVQVKNGEAILFSDSFEVPGLAMHKGVSAEDGATTFGKWVCNNHAGIIAGFPGNWGLTPQKLGRGDGTPSRGYLQAVFGTFGKMQATNILDLVEGQIYTVSFYQASRPVIGGEATYTVTLTELAGDATAPVITKLSAKPQTLSPPDGGMVRVAVSAYTDDAAGAVTSLKIISVTSNEPDSGLGAGDKAGDIEILDNLALNLRAERSDAGSGRIYTITVEAKDASGNASTKSCTVTVPVKQGN